MEWTKAKVTIQRTTGDAAGGTPSPMNSVPEEEVLAHESPSSSGMPVPEVTEEVENVDQMSSPSYSIPVEPTISPSLDIMDWTVSPITYVEQGRGTSTPDLQSLPPKVQERLEKIVKGTGDPIGSVIQQICEFFIEEESELSEGRLDDALIFYVTNLMI